ncbi:MAG TPA: phosphoribosylformylglycinamidine cyclo-ligase [Acidimicrobiales bacterium]|nr:phosphoribosylformylglycinamidine cyclo-ligase [Acidimicrobiales bacterium]
MGETYAAAGVDIEAGEAAVERIKAAVRSTFRPEVIGDVGGFGGLFAFDSGRYVRPVLVAGTDSVGTKAVVARLAGRFDTIGIDLVAMSVDDIAAQGAEPLFFLDCISAGRLDPEQMEHLVAGIATGCQEAGCALIGGEMAEVPGMLEPGHFDLVGFAVGVVERDRLVNGARVSPGDRLIGLPSPGLRCNGYSLARRILLDVAKRPLDGPAWPKAHHSLAEELLRPSVIYAPALVKLCRSVEVKGLAHITGGGIPGNLARVLPDTCDAIVVRSSWEVPEIFKQIQVAGNVGPDEMAKVFNLGIGMIAVVAPRDRYRAHDLLRDTGHDSVDIGEVVEGEGRVRLKL